MATLIAPSILSADFAHLADQVQAVAQAGADWIHVDVMDGSFVPNITMGPAIVAALRQVTTLPLDVHLMIVNPDRYVEAFAKAGADVITVHEEACTHLQRVLSQIRQQGCRAGVALNPATSPDSLRYVLDDVDLVLCMSVNPGFGGQKFIHSSLDKIRHVRALLTQSNREAVLIEVDGGVDASNAAAVIEAGAQVLVAGTAVFARPPYAQAIAALRSAQVG